MPRESDLKGHGFKPCRHVSQNQSGFSRCGALSRIRVCFSATFSDTIAARGATRHLSCAGKFQQRLLLPTAAPTSAEAQSDRCNQRPVVGSGILNPATNYGLLVTR